MNSAIRVLVGCIGLFLFSVSHSVTSCDTKIDIDVKNKVQQIAFDKTGMLNAGARIRIRLTSHSKCYAVVFWKNSHEEVFDLTSDATPNQSGVLLTPDAVHSLPDSWYLLDNQSGTETIVLVTSPQPMDDPGELKQSLANQELESFLSTSVEKGLSVNWKTIEHKATGQLSEFKLPAKPNQIQTDQPSLDNVVIPRLPVISLRQHDQQAESISKVAQTLTRGATQRLFNQVAPAVVFIYHNDGTGAGVLVDPRGLIVTSHHVVKGYEEVAVSLKHTTGSDFTSTQIYLAKIIRTSELHDLALLQLQHTPTHLPVMPLGDIDDIELGMTVHAIGHPGGMLWSYTRGIISQIRRNFIWNEYIADIVQTQTPINPGNSGGPLFDDNGRVVGINAAMFGTEGGSVGLNVAISVNHVKDLLGKHVALPPPDNFLPLSIRTLAIDSRDYDENGVPDVFFFDRNKNGVIDLIAVDKDEDGEADFWLEDQNENGIPDGRIYQTGNDNTTIFIFDIDIDEDGEYDWTGIDLDSDGEVDVYERYSD